MEPVNVVFFFVSTSPLHMHNISFFFATDTVHFFRFLTNVHRSCFLLTVPLSEYSLCRRYQKVIISDSRNGIQVCVLANQLYHIIIAWFLQRIQKLSVPVRELSISETRFEHVLFPKERDVSKHQWKQSSAQIQVCLDAVRRHHLPDL